MVSAGENRLQLRPLEKFIVPLAAIAGASMMPGALDGDAGRMLVIFLGLVSTSILPTVTLLVNSMSGGGRSVKAVEDLERELTIAMDAMFLLFGCVAIVVAALIALAIPTPWPLSAWTLLSAEILPRGGQAIVAGATAFVAMRLGQIPAILRKALSIRHRSAIDEAKRTVAENAPAPEQVRSAFKRHPDFGKTVPIKKVTGRKAQ